VYASGDGSTSDVSLISRTKPEAGGGHPEVPGLDGMLDGEDKKKGQLYSKRVLLTSECRIAAEPRSLTPTCGLNAVPRHPSVPKPTEHQASAVTMGCSRSSTTWSRPLLTSAVLVAVSQRHRRSRW
jgi:hypothetical protein